MELSYGDTKVLLPGVFHSQKLITFAHENPSFFDLKNVKIAFFGAQAPHRAGFCLFLRSKNKQKTEGGHSRPPFGGFSSKWFDRGRKINRLPNGEFISQLQSKVHKNGGLPHCVETKTVRVGNLGPELDCGKLLLKCDVWRSVEHVR